MSNALRGSLRRARRGTGAIGAAFLGTAVRVGSALRGRGPTSFPLYPKSLFVLRNNDIGDLLVATPLFEALRRRFPDARIVAGVGNWSVDVLDNNPYVSEVLPVNAPWFNKYQGRTSTLDRLLYLLSSEAQSLARQRFEIGIDVLGSAWGTLLMLRASIPFRLGVSGYAGGEAGVQAAVTFDPSEHVGRSALRFAEILGATELPPSRPQLFLSSEEQEWGEAWWAAAESGLRRQRVAVVPGGGLASKIWPAASFAAVAAGLASRGDVSLLVIGGPGEGSLLAAVADAAPAARQLRKVPSLRQVFALLAASDLVVCNSSMAMHVAAAFGKRTAVLLGQSMHSASAHQAQWGYPGTCWCLGREPGMKAEIATPEEALELVSRLLSASMPGLPLTTKR